MLLSPELVRTYFVEAAQRWGVSFDDVVGNRRYGAALTARREAVKRIAGETGALPFQIARVWGAHHTVVADLLAAPAKTALYDPRTVAQLNWFYGQEQASDIVSGVDIATELDRAQWRRLGEGAA